MGAQRLEGGLVGHVPTVGAFGWGAAAARLVSRAPPLVDHLRGRRRMRDHGVLARRTHVGPRESRPDREHRDDLDARPERDLPARHAVRRHDTDPRAVHLQGRRTSRRRSRGSRCRPGRQSSRSVVTDSDADDFVHWVIAGMDPKIVTEIREGEPPPSAVQALNDFGNLGMGRPLPTGRQDAPLRLHAVLAFRGGEHPERHAGEAGRRPHQGSGGRGDVGDLGLPVTPEIHVARFAELTPRRALRHLAAALRRVRRGAGVRLSRHRRS